MARASPSAVTPPSPPTAVLADRSGSAAVPWRSGRGAVEGATDNECGGGGSADGGRAAGCAAEAGGTGVRVVLVHGAKREGRDGAPEQLGLLLQVTRLEGGLEGLS